MIIPIESAADTAVTVANWLKSEWGEMPITKHLRSITHSSPTQSPWMLPKIFVYTEGSTPIGTIAILNDDMDIRPELNPWLGCLYVVPNRRNRGIGSELFDYCESAAAEIGVRKLFLFTSRIQKLALSRGWKAVEKVRFEGDLVTVMSKNLPLKK